MCCVVHKPCLLNFTQAGSNDSLNRFISFMGPPPRPRASYCTATRIYVRVHVQTMVNGVVSLEVDHKKGLVVVRGRPEAVEEGRKEFQNKLASLFPGDFLAVS